MYGKSWLLSVMGEHRCSKLNFQNAHVAIFFSWCTEIDEQTVFKQHSRPICPNALLSIIVLITDSHNKTFGPLFYYIMDHNNYYTPCILIVPT